MKQVPDISDISQLAGTLQRTANSASHFAALCEEKDGVIANRDTEIARLTQELAEARKPNKGK